MKSIWILVCMGVLAASCAAQKESAAQKEGKVENEAWRKLVDEQRAGKAAVVLRVHLLLREGGDKWAWDKVRLIGVIKNTSHHTFPAEFEVAHYSAESGIPDGDSTIYLEPYNPSTDTLWKLLEGSGTAGVSHAGTGK